MFPIEGGDEDSISNMIKKNHLFDDIDELKDHRSDMYDYKENNELDSLDLQDSYDKYDYLKEKQEEKLHKYDKLPMPKNPLDNYVDDFFENKEIMDELSKKDRKQIKKQAYRESSMDYVVEFRKLVDKVEKQLYKWVPKFDCYNYIIKDGNKYRCARNLKEVDKSSSTSDNGKIKFLRKLINESAFTDQIMTKYIRKYNSNPEFISDKDMPKIKKFYEDNIIKAFKKVISKYKY